MKIRWIGHAAFYIETSAGVRIRTDPYDDSIGLSASNLPADVVTISHEHYDHNAAAPVPGGPTVLRGLQDTLIEGVAIRSIQTYHDESAGSRRGINHVFVFEAEGLVLAHMGDLGHLPDRSFLAELGEVGVMCVPVGGVYTLDAEAALELIEMVRPAIAIPMHYRIPGLNIGIATVDDFLTRAGAFTEAAEVDVTPDTLPAPTVITVLSPRP